MKLENNGFILHIAAGKKLVIYIKNIEMMCWAKEDKEDSMKFKLVLDGQTDLPYTTSRSMAKPYSLLFVEDYVFNLSVITVAIYYQRRFLFPAPF